MPIVAQPPCGSRKELRAAASESVSNLRILVVDDNVDSADTAALLLELMGNHLETAHDGEEALAAAARFRPDVVLLDIGLPKSNGYQVARQIRHQPWGREVTLIAMTGWGQDDDVRRSTAAGFDHHLVKPVDPSALVALLLKVSTARAASPAEHQRG